MTEALPVCDASLTDIEIAEAAHPVAGVCVGSPVAEAEVRIVPFDFDPVAGIPDPVVTDAMGEILVRAPWVSDGYDGLWGIERAARPGGGWHRSGDVGHLDADGRLWVEGRSVHVIDTVDGPVTSVPLERAVERELHAEAGWVGRSAAIGIGPSGCQQIVIVDACNPACAGR